MSLQDTVDSLFSPHRRYSFSPNWYFFFFANIVHRREVAAFHLMDSKCCLSWSCTKTWLFAFSVAFSHQLEIKSSALFLWASLMESKRLQLPRKSTVVKIKIKLQVLKVLKSNHCTKSKRKKTKNQRVTFQGAKNQKNQKGSLFKHQNPRKIKTSKFKQNDELSSQKVEHGWYYKDFFEMYSFFSIWYVSVIL